MSAHKSPCRLRKVQCVKCGYVARITRSWLEVGLPGCPCGGRLEPTSPADQAFIGMVGPEDMSQREWNAICRENGWPIVLNQGQMTQALNKGRTIASTLSETAVKPTCGYAGCGRWVTVGHEHCSQHEQALEPVAAMPF